MQKRLAMLTILGAALFVSGLAVATESAPVLVEPGAEGVTAPYLIPSSRVSPSFPPAALHSRTDGVVMMRATVLRDGSVGSVKVLASSQDKLGFERAAIKAVRKWKFEPATQNDQPVDSYTLVRLKFRAPGSTSSGGGGGFVATDFPSAMDTAAAGSVASMGPMSVSALDLGAGERGFDPNGFRNGTLVSDDQSAKFQTYKKPPCATGCLYDRRDLVPPPNYGLAVVGVSEK